MAFNPEYLPVELNGETYAIDTTMYRRTTVPVSRQQRDNSREPGENTLDTTGAWVRSQTDWSYGAGQLYLDNEDSDRRRFYSSLGVDIWTKGEITLLSDTEDTSPSTDPGTGDLILERFVEADDEYIYLASDSTMFFSDDGGDNWTEQYNCVDREHDLGWFVRLHSSNGHTGTTKICSGCHYRSYLWHLDPEPTANSCWTNYWYRR